MWSLYGHLCGLPFKQDPHLSLAEEAIYSKLLISVMPFHYNFKTAELQMLASFNCFDNFY